MLPPSQDILPPRTMKDSLLKVCLPIGSCIDARLQYTSHIGGARLGRILQDMDHFAAVVLYKHILNPLQADPSGLSAHAVITARMDHLHIKEKIENDKDIILIGHVTWVGSSSAEVGVRVEQVMDEEGRRKHVCEARFVMVARDSATGTKAAPINPLILTTPEEKFLFSQGEKNIARRARADQDSLFKEPPAKEESTLIHKMFLSTIDHKARSFSARIKPEHSSWMTESKLKSVMLCEPEHKNDYNKVFGGLIMEKCMDLAFTNTWVYTGAELAPVCTHVDDVVFLKAVEIGDLLYFHSQVVFTHEKFVQTRVSAEVLDKKSKSLKLTNVLQITWELPEVVPSVVPKSYHEAMAYLTGRRHFLISLENQGLLSKGMAEAQVNEASSYLPVWFNGQRKYSGGVPIDASDRGDMTNDNDEAEVQEVLDEGMFMKADETKKIREREYGAM